jgi:hypothetical protein
MKNRFALWLKWILWYPVMVFLCLEIAFLILGYRSYHNDDYSIKANPANAFIGHPSFGIQLNPGTYDISINDSLHFKATHLENHTRKVSYGKKDSTDILLLGCSFTYGFGVNDDETFASLLQKEHPNLGFENDGVIGYGTVQSLLQLKEAVIQNPPKALILIFSKYHFMRNTLSPEYRSNLKTGYHRSSQNVDNLMAQSQFPYKTDCDSRIQLASWNEMYENWPGREWLASINWFQTLRDKFNENQALQIEVTVCLIKEMQAICKENAIDFGLVCLDGDVRTQAIKLALSDLPWLEVGFDFENNEWTNAPFDTHPSAAGHRYIANRIEPFLSQLLHED